MKKNSASILVFLCLIFFLKDSKGQDAFSSNLMKVNKSRGVPRIEIPLFNVKSGDISVPIVLNYNARGIKVRQSSGWVGLGWSISKPGYINNDISAFDEMNFNYVTHPMFVDADEFKAQINKSRLSFIKGGPHGTARFEDPYRGLASLNPTSHELYDYKLGDVAGNFVVRGKSLKQISKRDVYIDFVDKYIVDEKGRKFEFLNSLGQEIVDKIVCQDNERFGKRKFWNNFDPKKKVSKSVTGKGMIYLQSIISLNCNDTVRFDYQLIYPDTILSYCRNLKKIPRLHSDDLLNGGWKIEDDTISTIREQHELKTIYFKHGKVVFEPSADFNNKLDQIKVYKKSSCRTYQLVKNFKFYYKLFHENVEIADRYLLNTGGRVMLEKVEELCSGSLVAKMKYNTSIELPPIDVPDGMDHWGYYNGKHSFGTIKPTQTYFKKKALVVGCVPSFDWTNEYGEKVVLGDADKNSDEKFMKAGIIESIEYSHGAKVTYEFEANSHRGRNFTYNNPYANSLDKNRMQNVGGLRIAKINIHDANGQFIRGKLFKYHDLNDNETSGRLTSAYWPPLYHSVKKAYYSDCGTVVQLPYIRVNSNARVGVNSDHILYEDVLEYDIDEYGNYLGCIYSKYSFELDAKYSVESPNISKSSGRGRKLNEMVYKIENGKHIPVRSGNYEYEIIDPEKIKAFHISVNNPYIDEINSGWFDNLYNAVNYYYDSERVVLKKSSSTSYYANGNFSVNKLLNYSGEHSNPDNIITTSSDGNEVKEILKYKTHHIDKTNAELFLPETREIYTNDYLIKASKIEYDEKGNPNLFYTNNGSGKNKFTVAGSIGYDLEKSCKYNDNSNLVEEHNIVTGEITNYIWGYNNSLIVAEIKNAKFHEVESVLGVHFNLGVSGLTEYQEIALRERLKGAFITTFTYDPLNGKTSETDANGITVYYVYDKIGRLKYMKDENHRIVKSFEYHTAQ